MKENHHAEKKSNVEPINAAELKRTVPIRHDWIVALLNYLANDRSESSEDRAARKETIYDAFAEAYGIDNGLIGLMRHLRPNNDAIEDFEDGAQPVLVTPALAKELVDFARQGLRAKTKEGEALLGSLDQSRVLNLLRLVEPLVSSAKGKKKN